MIKQKPFALAGIALIILFSLLMFSACNGGDTNAPSGLAVDSDYILTWLPVKEAKSYVVEVKKVSDGSIKDNKTSRVRFSLAKLDVDDYEIKVKAVMDNDKETEWSEVLKFNKPYETGLVYTLINNNSEYAITSGGTASGKVVIEDFYRGKPVTKIEEYAFYKTGAFIEEIVIGNNVTSIGKSAFFNCTNLKSVTFPESLKTIGEAAFEACNALDTVVIPSGVTVIGDEAFARNSALVNLTIGDNVESIGDSAFFKCSVLTKVTIPDSVTSIGDSAFAYMEMLKEVNIGKNVAQIGGYAFYFNKSLTDINFSDAGNLTTIGESAFAEAKSLVSVEIPEGVTTLGKNTFYACELLENVTISESVVRVGAYSFNNTKLYTDAVAQNNLFVYADNWVVASLKPQQITAITTSSFKEGVVGIADAVFYNSEALKSVQLASTIKYIGNYTFSYCENLIGVIAEKSLVSVGDYAFYKDTLLSNVRFSWDRTTKQGLKTIGNYAFYGCTSLDNNVYGGSSSFVPDTVTQIGTYAFKNTALWGKPVNGVIYAGSWVVGYDSTATGTITLQTGTIGIANYAFYQNSLLQAVIGLGKVDYIGRGAFYECTALDNIILSDNLKAIEDYTFYKCSSLAAVTFPLSLVSIGRSAFYKCEKLETVDLSSTGVKTIGDYAFYGNTNIKNLRLGKKLQSIGQSAFYGNTSLAELSLPDSLTVMGDRAFGKNSGLTSVLIGSGLEYIPSRAFYKAQSLTSVDIPDTILSIGDYAFYKNDAMINLNIGNSVKQIGNYAFYGTTSLTSVTIPNSVKSIGNYAFKDAGIVSIVLKSSVEYVGAHAFYGCKNLTIYLNAAEVPAGWNTRWNSLYRPVVTGSVLSDDKAYVAAVVIDSEKAPNANNLETIAPPQRAGYTFAGWSTQADGESQYSTAQIFGLENGTTVYAVYAPEAGSETHPPQE